jgi:hypothetical protein
VDAGRIEEFVMALGGKGLSVREVERLAQVFFKGPDSFRREILRGHLRGCLEQAAGLALSGAGGCTGLEQGLLGDLELMQKCMSRVMSKSQDRRLKSPAFHAQSHLLCGGILSQARPFFHLVRRLHDRSGQT